MRWDPLGMGLWIHAGFFVRSSDLCRQFRERSFGEVILALQALDAVRVGVDNLNAVRQVGRLLVGSEGSRPAELENDDNWLALLREMIEGRSEDTVRITEVMVQVGRVRELDRVGNNQADEAC